MAQYWVVGAMRGGKKDYLQKFIRRGYWELFWKDDNSPFQERRRNKIKPGDRIAVKRRMASGTGKIRIVALGVVTEIDPDDKRVYVNWLVADLDREVESNGCLASIHGPYAPTDPWVRQVFFV